MTDSIDTHEVLMTGENSFIRLSHDGGTTMSDRTSHWRVLWCPAGCGHALFMQGELTGGSVRIYGDNIAVVRWLQRTIETLLHAPFADEGVSVVPAEVLPGGRSALGHHGNGGSRTTTSFGSPGTTLSSRSS